MPMRMPAMILFDYGNTLLHEPDINFHRGEQAVFEHITANPKSVTVEEAFTLGTKIFADCDACRKQGFELHEYQMLQLKYDALGLTFDLPMPELERLLWTAASPAAVMPGAPDMLADLRRRGIRTGVISNIGWSGQALGERITRMFPGHPFEFILASSEYGVRKPNPLLFRVALTRAGLEPEQIWYCGDTIRADVYGAQTVGMFPVLYESAEVDNPLAGKNDGLTIDGEHLHIRYWRELTAALDALEGEK